MASSDQVKQYLAYWLQLGKWVVLHSGDQKRCPKPVYEGNRYSSEFEQCWQEILSLESGDCYLEGTETSIRELLTSSWEIDECARCSMPIPFRTQGMPPNCCPCFDLPSWPNTEIPQPRLPADTHQHLLNLRDRLEQLNSDDIASA